MSLLSGEEYIQFKNFHLRQPLWESIENLVQCHDERLEVKKVIGQSLVDETLDLHIEVTTLYGIWDETQDATFEDHKASMPEPPFLRENLEKQITLLVDLLKQKLNKQGEGAVSAFLSEEDRKLIKSVSSDHMSRCTRSSSVTSCGGGGDTPSSGYDSRCSSSLSVDANTLRDNISISELDQLAQPLRDDFEEERSALLKDISYIQNVLIFESDMMERKRQRKTSSFSIKDLQSLTNRLEKEVLVTSTTANTDKKTHHHSTRTHQSRSAKLKPLSHNNNNSKIDKIVLRPAEISVAAARDFTLVANTNNNKNMDCSEVKLTPSPPPSSTTVEDTKKIPTPPSSGRTRVSHSHVVRSHAIHTKKRSNEAAAAAAIVS